MTSAGLLGALHAGDSHTEFRADKSAAYSLELVTCGMCVLCKYLDVCVSTYVCVGSFETNVCMHGFDVCM